MDCQEVEARNVAEQYLLGQLTEAEQQAFEEHYFDCPRCYAQLRDLRDLQQELGQIAPQIRQERAAPVAAWMPRWAWLASAAVALVVAGLLLVSRTPVRQPPSTAKAPPAPAVTPASRPTLAELAKVQPPAYTPVTLRGGENAASRAFRAAMELYRSGQYKSAIPGLSQAVRLDPHDAGSRFFLGICHLLTGQTEAAIVVLQQVLALGDTPYLEEAHFYLAKAYLQRNDLATARQQLQETINLHGDLESDAKKLLTALDAVPRSPQ
jgi:tetratricopeptide (TPR) repeat protein